MLCNFKVADKRIPSVGDVHFASSPANFFPVQGMFLREELREGKRNGEEAADSTH